VASKFLGLMKILLISCQNLEERTH